MISPSQSESIGSPQCGQVIFDLRDARTGEVLEHWEKHNLVTLDSGILSGRLFKNTELPVSGRNNGMNMMGVGTGGFTLLNTTRHLEIELIRKAFNSVTYVDPGGAPSAVPTRAVNFEAVFGAAEAIGALNEMCLMYTADLNPAVTNPIMNGPYGYDPTIDVSGKDILANYICWDPPSVKPPATILTVNWIVKW